MSRNRDIRGFFSKKALHKSKAPYTTSGFAVVESVEETRLQHQPTPAPSSDPLSDLPSSPLTPQRNVAKTPLKLDDVIKGSEDEEDDSDGSLASLSELLGTKAKPATYRRPTTITTTPKAKRIATANFHRSPLTLQQQRKHKFDLDSLLKHAKQDDATEESARRGDELKAKAAKEAEEDAARLASREEREIFANEDEEKGGKLAMAIDRTVGDEHRPRCYFFKAEGSSRGLPKRPFPKKAAKTKPWAMLQDASTRNQMFIRGIPTTLAMRGKELPDELYQWILDETCLEKNLQLRMQYINLAALCHDDTHRLFNERQLSSMLERLEVEDYTASNNKFVLSPGLQDPYPGKDWSPLRYFLQLMAHLAPDLSLDIMISSMRLLLRMSLDPSISTVPGLRNDYHKAMVAMVNAFPRAENPWNSCCQEICNYLYVGVAQASQRNIAITLLPTSTPRLVELQRRLASEALLDEPGLGGRHPDDSVTIQDLFSRLTAADFQINHSTNYDEFNALISLLDIVIDSGAHLYRAHLALSTGPQATNSSSTRLSPFPTPVSTTTTPSASTSTPTPSPEAAAEAAAKFDADIDRLRVHLKGLHDHISDNSLVSRKEAKAALDGMLKRLTLTVRSRPPPKSSIFDDGIYGRAREDANLPRQRDFMKKWTAGKA